MKALLKIKVREVKGLGDGRKFIAYVCADDGYDTPIHAFMGNDPQSVTDQARDAMSKYV